MRLHNLSGKNIISYILTEKNSSGPGIEARISNFLENRGNHYTLLIKVPEQCLNLSLEVFYENPCAFARCFDAI